MGAGGRRRALGRRVSRPPPRLPVGGARIPFRARTHLHRPFPAFPSRGSGYPPSLPGWWGCCCRDCCYQLPPSHRRSTEPGAQGVILPHTPFPTRAHRLPARVWGVSSGGSQLVPCKGQGTLPRQAPRRGEDEAGGREGRREAGQPREDPIKIEGEGGGRGLWGKGVTFQKTDQLRAASHPCLYPQEAARAGIRGPRGIRGPEAGSGARAGPGPMLGR